MHIKARTTFAERREWLPSAVERELWALDDGTGEDRIFRHQVLQHLPTFFERPVSGWYQHRAQHEGIAAANRWLYRIVEQVQGSTFRLGASDAELIEYAERRARDCRLIALRCDVKTAHARAAEFATREGITPPAVKGRMTEAGALARLCCERWWRRAARRTHGRKLEGAAVNIGMVHKRADIYASEPTVQRRREQKTRNRRALEAMQAVNELGDAFTLAELSDLSVSNPTIRRGELMTRIAGFEQVANATGHDGVFITWTCPSRMHARLIESGEQNPAYDGTTPREAHRYLGRQWAKARAALARLGVEVYGFRIAEPHHDATPHWHMLFFLPPDQVDTLEAVLSRYALEVDGDEPGAKKYRFKSVRIDKERGSAAGYVAKYVAKNIDGFGVDVDLFGKDPKKGAQRVDAWASTWGIRQFQQIGGPPVTVWRELRRLGEEEQSGEIERARFAANLGDWAGYTIAQGGPVVPRIARPVASVKKTKPTRYGDDGESIIGVCSRADGLFVLTRVHSWTIKRATTDAGVSVLGGGGKNAGGVRGDGARPPQVSGGERDTGATFFLAARDFRAPWSSVNNCTRVDTGPPD